MFPDPDHQEDLQETPSPAEKEDELTVRKAAIPADSHPLLLFGWARPRAPASGDTLRVMVHEDAQKSQGDARVAKQSQAASEKPMGEKQVSHHVEVPQNVDGEGGGQREDAEAGQVVKDRAQAAEQHAGPQAGFVG